MVHLCIYVTFIIIYTVSEAFAVILQYIVP